MGGTTPIRHPLQTRPRATKRSCGKALSPRLAPGDPKLARFSGVSATSRQEPPRLTSRHARYHAPLVACGAIGRTPCSYRRCSGAAPRRVRACEMPLRPATLTASAPQSQRRPSKRQRKTSRVLEPMSGSFGSRLFEDGERLVAMFGEVLLALDGTVPPASMDGEGGVSQGGEGLGGVARSGAAGVLAAGPIADVVQAVLDSPMPSRDVEQ